MIYKSTLYLFLILANFLPFTAQLEETGFDINWPLNWEEEEEDKNSSTTSTMLCNDNSIPEIKNGKYVITNKDKEYANNVKDRLELIFECHENTVLVPPVKDNKCYVGKWDHDIFPQCLPFCNNDNWTTSCVPDCDLRNSPDVSQKTNDVQLGDFAYHVGIYFRLNTKDEHELKYICGGSIISVRLVLTSAYCVTHSLNDTVISLDVYDVFVEGGKFYSNYQSSLDTHAQKRQVVKMAFRDSIDRASTASNDQKFLAVLVTDEPFIFDHFVQPVCVHFGELFEFSFRGYVVGWGDNKYKVSNALKLRLVTYISKINASRRRVQTTLKYTTSKKICSNSDQGCDICVGDIGSGLVVAYTTNGRTKYFIRRVVSGKGWNGNICGGATSIDYINVYRRNFFLIQLLAEYPNIVSNNATALLAKSTSCSVPIIPNGRLLMSGKSYSSRKRVPNQSVIYIECNSDTYLSPPATKFIVCQDGKFNTEVPKCSRKCAPLKSETINLSCDLAGVITNCAAGSFEGTVVTMLCHKDYWNRLTDDHYTVATCRDGVWDQPFMTCQGDCALKVHLAHISIYQNTPDDSENSRGKYICAGTVISYNMVLSAAQCFTNDSNGELLNLESFSLYAQTNKSSVRKILDVKIPKEYKGELSNYTGNLAVIKLDKPFHLNTDDIVVLACFEQPLNYLEELTYAHFRKGFIFGTYDSKVKRKSKSSAYELFLHFDYYLTIDPYNVTECIYDVTKDMETSDKFCAGKLVGALIAFETENNTGLSTIYKTEYSDVCFASPGAGYMTAGKNGDDLFLQGVASFHIPNKNCTINEEKYLFTAIEKYQTFLKLAMDEFSLCKIPDLENSSFTVSDIDFKINNAIPNFSIVRVKCASNFQIFPPFFDLMTCNNGIYDQKLPYCIQCGQNKMRQLDVQDNATDGVTVPWHVVIYHDIVVNQQTVENKTNSITYQCVGSLIHPRIIITNSLCFPDNIEDFQITVGKQNIRNSNLRNFTQKQNLHKKDVKIFNEIALIILENSLTLNENVQPICLDWKDEYGYQEMNSSQPGIVTPSINDNKIRQFYEIDSSEAFLQPHKNSLSPSDFNARTIDDPNTCPKAVGSGIATENKNSVFFLRGLFTIMTNELLPFCTFIKVSYYLPFLINIVESIDI